MNSFHYAFKVKDLESTREFYIDLLGCKEGRYSETWVDFDFFGHQLSAHVSDNIPELDFCGKVDQISVPIPHFGCIVEKDNFEKIEQKLNSANIEFLIKPQKRYEGKTSEQLTLFVLDYSGNPIEFKSYSEENSVFKI